MAYIDDLQAGLVKADAAGNVEDAKAFADEIRKIGTTQPQPAPTQQLGQTSIPTTGTPFGKAVLGGSKMALGAVLYPFEKLGQFAQKAGDMALEQKTFGKGEGSIPYHGSPLAATAVDVGIQSLPIPANLIAKGVKAAKDIPNTFSRFREMGYKIPPTMGEPGVAGSLMEGLGGKAKTQQGASILNQSITNSKVKKEFNIPQDQELTIDAFEEVRRNAGKAYEDIKKTGQVISDLKYVDDLDKIASRYKQAASGFPQLSKPEVINLVKGMKEPTFNAREAVDQISLLREDATKSFKAGDASLGQAYKESAKALEDQLGRHLERIGASPEVIKNYKDARATIAKTYIVQKHYYPTGNVDATGLAKELKAGKPLTGDLKDVAEFGSRYGQAAKRPELIGGVPPISPVEAGMGGTISAVMHNPVYMAALTVPPFARHTALSDIYQNALAKSGAGTMTRLQANPFASLAEVLAEQRQGQP